MPISKFTVNKFIAGMANFLSTILSPLLMPTFGVFLLLWVSVLCLQPTGRRTAFMLVCMGISILCAAVIYLVLTIALRMVTREDLRLIPGGEKLARLLHIR